MVRMAERLAHTVEQLLLKIKGGARVDRREFYKLCLIFSKIIDLTIANNQFPISSREPLQLVRQVLSQREDQEVRPAIMTVVLSFKAAYKAGWFDETECAELLGISNTMIESYNHVSNSTPYDAASVKHIMTDVMARYYPWIRVNNVFFAVQLEAGYTAAIYDFNATGQIDQMRLFTIRRDRLHSPTCLTVPAVSFLINGYGIEKRTSMTPDVGTQPPADCTRLVRSGNNVLQVVGDFPAGYIVAVASTVAVRLVARVSDLPEVPFLPYTSHTTDEDDVTVGPSKVSLCCPISRKRINSPVKGKYCKHLQCFDYNNYHEVNYRRPSWRCPCCDLRITLSDICLDKRTAEILRKVGDNVTEVLIGKDSWEPVVESYERGLADKVIDVPDSDEHDDPRPFASELVGSFVGNPVLLDVEDRKPNISRVIPTGYEGQSSNRAEYDISSIFSQQGSQLDREMIMDHLLSSRIS